MKFGLNINPTFTGFPVASMTVSLSFFQWVSKKDQKDTAKGN